MSSLDSPRGGSVPAASASANGLTQSRHTRSQVTSYDAEPVKVNRPRPRNLSPTRPPTTASDLALWPSWTDAPYEEINLDLFAEDGSPLFSERGV